MRALGGPTFSIKKILSVVKPFTGLDMLKIKPRGHFGGQSFYTFRSKNCMKICDLNFYLMSHHHRRRLQNCRNKREMLQPIKKIFLPIKMECYATHLGLWGESKKL